MKKKIQFFVITFMSTIVLLACSEITNDSEAELIEASVLEKNIKDVSIIPSDPVNLDQPYEITIHLTQSIQNQQLPNGLILCGLGNSKLIRRNIETEVEYSGYVEAKVAKKIYLNSFEKNKVAMKNLDDPGASIGCSFSVTKPGEYDENCEETCPETSMLGGETWFCVCFYDCEFEIDLF